MRIIESQDARRFNCEATLYDFSDLDQQLGETIRLELANPVPVYSANRTYPVGYAVVFVNSDEHKLKAELYMDYATPERLSMEVGDEVYAIPEGDFSVNARTNRVDGVWLPQITLGARNPAPGIGGVCRFAADMI